MSEIVDFALADGTKVYVKTTEREAGRVGLRGGAAGAAAEAARSFEAALAKVKPAARAVVEAFRELNNPDEIGLEVGLEFSTQYDAFVFSGEASAAFKLRLTWKNEKQA